MIFKQCIAFTFTIMSLLNTIQAAYWCIVGALPTASGWSSVSILRIFFFILEKIERGVSAETRVFSGSDCKFA